MCVLTLSVGRNLYVVFTACHNFCAVLAIPFHFEGEKLRKVFQLMCQNIP